jgi:hypothetical protein
VTRYDGQPRQYGWKYHEVKVTPRLLLDYKIRIMALEPGKIFFDFKRSKVSKF